MQTKPGPLIFLVETGLWGPLFLFRLVPSPRLVTSNVCHLSDIGADLTRHLWDKMDGGLSFIAAPRISVLFTKLVHTMHLFFFIFFFLFLGYVWTSEQINYDKDRKLHMFHMYGKVKDGDNLLAL